MFFTSSGKVFQTKAHEIPVATRTSKGRALVNFLEIGPEEIITAVVPVKVDLKKTAGLNEKFLVMITRNGIIKKTAIEDFANVRRSGLIAVKLKKGDELTWVKLTSGRDELILVSRNGQSIRFAESDVRDMGRAASGVNGIRLKNGDKIAGADVIGSKDKDGELLIVMSRGYAKRTKLKFYKCQRRAGSGIKTAKVTAKTGAVVSASILDPEEQDLIVVSKKGQVIRTAIGGISVLGRATQGVRVMKMKEGDEIASITTL